jgi:hypothetical protein
MPLRKFFFILCLIVWVFCLAAGYWFANQWIGAALAVLLGPGWLLAPKYQDAMLPHICLFISVGLAVAGILIGASPLLMIFSSAMAVAVWDLALLESALKMNSTNEQTRQYEARHLQSLMLALGFGLFATLAGYLVNIRLPFFIMIPLLIFLLFALERVWFYIKKTG